MALNLARRTEQSSGTTCVYWLAGRCNRNPCRFLHIETPSPSTVYYNGNTDYPYPKKPKYNSNTAMVRKSADGTNVAEVSKKPLGKTPTYNSKAVLIRKSADGTNVAEVSKKPPGKTPTYNSKAVLIRKSGDGTRATEASQKPHVKTPAHDTKEVLIRKSVDETSVAQASQKPPQKTPYYESKAVLIRKSEDGDGTSIPEASQKLSRSVCTYWMNGNCVHGDQCCNLHSWFYGDGISALARLHEHKEVVTGIALPVGSDKLYSGSTDGTVRMWDCNSGQCARVINLGAKVTSLITEGPWVFVGIRNSIKAWNIQTASEFTLDGPNGQVLAMTFVNDTLLAGAEDGVIYAWRGSSESKTPFELIASLRGHTEAVVCLCVGRNMIYSGSKDHSIKVWDLDTLQCERTLNGHTEVVTSLICWELFLLSSSSDCTIKVWGFTKEENLEVIYTHREENGVLALCGMIDAEAKPILYCSCRDNSVRMYDLPSFSERGRLFSQKDVRSLHIGPDRVGLFFTGDETGLLTVWKWLGEPKVP